MSLQVLAFIVLNLPKHVVSSLIEVSFNIELFVSQVIDQCSLFNEIIFSLKSYIFHLLLCVSHVLHLFLFWNISPHCCELLGFVSGVNVIENSELGTKEVSEVADFSISKIESDKIFVMPDHTSEPFVMWPPSKSGNGVDCSNVEENKQKSSSASGKSLVVRRDLLWANSLEQGFHVVEVREHNWVFIGVIWMNVSLFHSLDVLLVVSLSVFSFVNSLLSTINNDISHKWITFC